MENKSQYIISIKQKLKSLNSSFIIQAGHPKALYLKQNEFKQVHQVFPKLFSENDERAILIWNKIPVLFSYTYGWFSNFDQLVSWLYQLAFQKTGSYEFTLNTDDFLTTIKAHWKENLLWIESEWLEKRTHDVLAKKLNETGMLRIEIMDFLREWKVLLLQITQAFKKADVKISDHLEKEKFLTLFKIINQIKGQGKRYTR